MSDNTTYAAGEHVRVRAVRRDIPATVIEQEGSLIAVRVDATGQIVAVPAGVVYR